MLEGEKTVTYPAMKFPDDRTERETHVYTQKQTRQTRQTALYMQRTVSTYTTDYFYNCGAIPSGSGLPQFSEQIARLCRRLVMSSTAFDGTNCRKWSLLSESLGALWEPKPPRFTLGVSDKIAPVALTLRCLTK